MGSKMSEKMTKSGKRPFFVREFDFNFVKKSSWSRGKKPLTEKTIHRPPITNFDGGLISKV